MFQVGPTSGLSSIFFRRFFSITSSSSSRRSHSIFSGFLAHPKKNPLISIFNSCAISNDAFESCFFHLSFSLLVYFFSERMRGDDIRPYKNSASGTDSQQPREAGTSCSSNGRLHQGQMVINISSTEEDTDSDLEIKGRMKKKKKKKEKQRKTGKHM